jgi:hypothetical protein
MNISKTITIELMYRDGGNYKNDYCETFSNDKQLTDEEIEKEIQKLIDQTDEGGVFTPFYGMPNFTTITSPHIKVSENSLDHCYTEVTGVSFSSACADYYCDISEVIELINNPEKRKPIEEKYRLEAIEDAKKLIEELTTP